MKRSNVYIPIRESPQTIFDCLQIGDSHLLVYRTMPHADLFGHKFAFRPALKNLIKCRFHILERSLQCGPIPLTNKKLQCQQKRGTRVPLHSTGVGKMLLSQWSTTELDSYPKRMQLIPHTPKTLVSRPKIRKELEQISTRGFSVDNEEMEAAVRILESEGVKNIFGIPGAGILPFYRAFKDLGTI